MGRRTKARDKGTPAERVRYCLQEFFANSQTKMAAVTGLTQGAISNVVRGVFPPGRDFLLAIALHSGVDAAWLLTGTGSPQRHHGDVLPVARELLPGLPCDYPGLLTGATEPVAKCQYAESRYFVTVRAEHIQGLPDTVPIFPGQLLLCDGNVDLWHKKTNRLLNHPCVVRVGREEPSVSIQLIVDVAADHVTLYSSGNDPNAGLAAPVNLPYPLRKLRTKVPAQPPTSKCSRKKVDVAAVVAVVVHAKHIFWEERER